jgi:hypothetical protein
MKAILCKDAENGPAGAIELRTLPGEDQHSGIAFKCPCGCGLDSWLPFSDTTFEGWQWDGSTEAPTLRPSVLNRQCGWHGHLTNGEWVEC